MFRTKKVNIQQAKIKLIQEKIFLLVKEMLKVGVDIHMAPRSGRYFLVDKENQVSIEISTSKIRIANHKFTYSENLPLTFIEKVETEVKNAMESRAEKLKKELFRNEVELLDFILKSFVKETE